jgi:hypothetical protein
MVTEYLLGAINDIAAPGKAFQFQLPIKYTGVESGLST